MQRLRKLVLVLLLGLAPRPLQAGGSAPNPAPDATVLRYRDDAIVVRLRPEPARQALAFDRGPRPDAVTAERLGVPDLDRIAADLGGARFEREFRGAAPSATARRSGLDLETEADLAAFLIVHLPPAIDRERALAAFRGSDAVESAEPIAIVAVEAIPNDSLWGNAYYFQQPSGDDLDAPAAWDITTGDSSVAIAILDTGVLLHHPDLIDRIWVNALERSGTPGVDDDGNGYVDDDRGWDFVALQSEQEVVPGEDWRDEDNDPDDFVGHGTAVAGIAAARTNNRIGIASTAWNARLMPLRVGWSGSRAPSGEIDLSAVAQALAYAARAGARVANCSFTTTSQSDLVAAANAAVAAGVAIVTAGGNGQPAHYLATREDVIAVAASDAGDRVAGFSTLGRFIDLCAPGVTIATTSITRPGTDSLGLRQPTYSTTASGTSFASPFVAGAVALLQSDRIARGQPPLSTLNLLLRLRDTADDISPRNPGVTGYGSGRLNLHRALTESAISYVVQTGATTVGPGVVLPSATGPARVAFAMSNGSILMVEGTPGATPHTVPLPAPPQGGIAAATIGGCFQVTMFLATEDGWIGGYDEWGSPLPGWPVRATVNPGILTEPALGDLDGDGVLEIVWPGSDGRIYAWRADGIAVPGFPARVDAIGPMSIALSDLDGRPGVEVVAVTASGIVTVHRGDGRSLAGWPQQFLPDPFPPIVMRLGSDPRPAIVVAAGNQIAAFDSAARERWIRYVPGEELLPLAAGDLDGDGRDEIVLSRRSRVMLLDSLGFERGGWDAVVWRIGSDPGAVLIGSLDPDGSPAVLANVYPGDLTAYDRFGGRLPAFPKPGRASASPTIADLDGDGRSQVVAGSGSEGDLFLYDAGAGTWNAAAQQWPTARGNFARTGSRLYAPPLALPTDPLPPSPDAVTLTRGASGNDWIELLWTAPANPGGGTVRYDLRSDPRPFDDASFPRTRPVSGVPAAGPPGTPERMVVSGLVEGESHFFALRVVYCGGQASPISNLVEITPTRVAPGPVSDLRVTRLDFRTVTVAWTATGDDGSVGRPRRYQVRAAEYPLDERSFAAAPFVSDRDATVDAGGAESAALSGLACGGRYWIALRAEDEVANLSPISNVVEVEDPPPAAVGDLRADPIGPRSLDLRWSSPSDAGLGGWPVLYDLRVSATPIDEEGFEAADPVPGVGPPRQPGTLERLAIGSLRESHTYYFAIRSADCAGSWSAISNPLAATTTTVRPDPVRDLRVLVRTIDSVTVGWTATGDDRTTGRPRRYLLRAADGPIDESNFDSAPYRADHPATVDAGGQEVATLRGLGPGHHWIAVRAEDDGGNRSAISNVVPMLNSPLAGREGIALASGAQPARPPVQLFWQNGIQAPAASQELRVFDLAGRVVRRFRLEGAEGIVLWDGRDSGGGAVPAGLYFARLMVGPYSAQTRVMILK